MIKNFITIAIRNIFKHKVFSAINIFGLAIGIAACLLILQYVRFELSYDHFEKDGAQIYRLQQDRFNEGRLSTQWAAGATGVGPAITKALPEIESFARLYGDGGVITYKDQFFRENRMYYAGDTFLPMFGYTALAGSITGALKEVNTAVITHSAALKYFGQEDPIGKMISRNKKDHYKITAVVADPPANTHLQFDILLSFATFVKMTQPEAETTFDWDGFMTYIKVKPGTDPSVLEKKINGVVQQQIGADLKQRNEGIQYHLQPLADIHLYSHYMMEAGPNGDGHSVYFLLIIAIFIILIAWINYINLSTARSIDRAREVGIRKVLGSYRQQLIGQFLFESMLVNLMAVILAFILVVTCLPLFNMITGKQISFTLLQDSKFWLSLAGLFLTGTILAGLYPAFALSSFKPIAVLKGRLASTSHGALLRQTLVIIQFTASVILIAGTFAVYRQLHFMQHQDLGVQIDQTLVLKGPNVIDSTYSDRMNAFKTEMLRQPGVTAMTASTEVPGSKVGWNAGGIRLVGSDPSKTNQYRVIGIDYDFLDVYGLKLLKGRNFSKTFSNDPKTVLLNEAAVTLMGFHKPEEALNKQIEFWGDQYTIVGVVANHHQESLRQAYDAHIFRLIPDAKRYYSIKLRTTKDQWPQSIQAAEKQWASFFPGNPFEYFFLDDHFAEQYKADRQFGNTFGLFAILAIFVSCMGLLGLASFVTTQRTKEIGIRKISGASIMHILLLLTRDFMRPVLIALLLALPLTGYLLQQWLHDFAFKISLDVWIFVLPVLLIVVVAVGTISTQTIRAASANPVKSLRTE